MLQLNLSRDVHASDTLKRHIEDNAVEIESAVGDEVPLSFRVRRIAKNVFSIDLHARLFGRLFVVKEQDSNLYQAVNRARRHLLRQVGDTRRRRIDRYRRQRAFA